MIAISAFSNKMVVSNTNRMKMSMARDGYRDLKRLSTSRSPFMIETILMIDLSNRSKDSSFGSAPCITKNMAMEKPNNRVVITTAPGLACKLTQGRAASNPVCGHNIAVAAVVLTLAAPVCMIVRALSPKVIATAVFIDSIASRGVDLAAFDARVRVIAVAADRTVRMLVARTELRTAEALLAERRGRAATVAAR